jgi:hypothetical protein
MQREAFLMLPKGSERAEVAQPWAGKWTRRAAITPVDADFPDTTAYKYMVVEVVS